MRYFEIISCHPRKQHNFEQAKALSEIYGKRFRHITSLYFSPRFIKIISFVSKKIGQNLGRRSLRGLSKAFVFCFYKTEFKRILLSLLRIKYNYSDYNIKFQRSVLKKFVPPDVCISYDDMSYLIFKEWKGKSYLILDLTIGFPLYKSVVCPSNYLKSINYHEFIKSPAGQDYVNRYYKEIELADLILCGSEFVKNSILHFQPDFESKITVLPYGFDNVKYSIPKRTHKKVTEELNFIFIGTISLRKGVDVLLDAWAKFVSLHTTCHLNLYGHIDNEFKDYCKLNTTTNITFHGFVNTSAIPFILEQADVFILPTNFEGSSIAIYQAMASNLPIITTFNSGSVLQNNISGLLINPGDSEELVNALIKITDVVLRKNLSQNAFEMSKNFTWDSYRDRLKYIFETRVFKFKNENINN